MDYRLIKENFDKATAGVEEAQQGAAPFAVGDKVRFSQGSMSMRKNKARGTVTGIEPAGVARKHSDGLSREAYIVTVQWDNYEPVSPLGLRFRSADIGDYYDDELVKLPEEK